MLFKDVHIGGEIFVFDRNNLTIDKGKASNVTSSHIDPKIPTGKLVVDITVSIGDKTQSYTVEDSLQVAYFGNNAISCDRDAILQEIESMKANSEQVLKDIDRHKQLVTKCNQLLMEYNPALKEKQENEMRFSSIESKIDRLASMLEKVVN